MNEIFPRALMVAARTFADRPKIVGEILVALVEEAPGEAAAGATAARPDATGARPARRGNAKDAGPATRNGLSEVQQYILAECREEIRERERKREGARERKRKERNNKKGTR